ncbi:MAG: hypothetical protein HQL69_24050 [Magnetococcales bacterium]|nr:hypothetical protein [Magnetococcales bacterium]
MTNSFKELEKSEEADALKFRYKELALGILLTFSPIPDAVSAVIEGTFIKSRKCLKRPCKNGYGTKQLVTDTNTYKITGYWDNNGFSHGCNIIIIEDGRKKFEGPMKHGWADTIKNCPQKKSRLFYKGGEDGYREGIMRKGKFEGIVTYVNGDYQQDALWENGKLIRYIPKPSSQTSRKASNYNTPCSEEKEDFMGEFIECRNGATQRLHQDGEDWYLDGILYSYKSQALRAAKANCGCN